MQLNNLHGLDEICNTSLLKQILLEVEPNFEKLYGDINLISENNSDEKLTNLKTIIESIEIYSLKVRIIDLLYSTY